MVRVGIGSSSSSLQTSGHRERETRVGSLRGRGGPFTRPPPPPLLLLLLRGGGGGFIRPDGRGDIRGGAAVAAAVVVVVVVQRVQLGSATRTSTNTDTATSTSTGGEDTSKAREFGRLHAIASVRSAGVAAAHVTLRLLHSPQPVQPCRSSVEGATVRVADSGVVVWRDVHMTATEMAHLLPVRVVVMLMLVVVVTAVARLVLRTAR